jgi:hypothetical protein
MPGPGAAPVERGIAAAFAHDRPASIAAVVNRMTLPIAPGITSKWPRVSRFTY